MTDMSLHSSRMGLPATLLPVNAPIDVRLATMGDLPFIDALQKKNSRAVGFMPTMQLQGKIERAEILVAARDAALWGYLIGADRYFKHDDIGILYAINVIPEARRSLVAATLLKAQFERSAYGCKLYCCWCAQDLAANKFWEAMGFHPLAFRAGSATRGTKQSPRIHIFWQKRIRSGDTSTPWWFPAKTDGGALRADRLVLPIPPGVRWDDAMPVMVAETRDADLRRAGTPESPTAGKKEAGLTVTPHNAPQRPGGMWFADASPPVVVAAKGMVREKKTKEKVDPALIAAARELRDRYLEQVNQSPTTATAGKYDVSRVIEAQRGAMGQQEQTALIEPAAVRPFAA